ncbi:MAG: CrcB family protein [Lactobacillales bacterium]|jgi:CrcB protein|nr:CrcB family protein [Lactobacillales bacterium]
MIEGLFIGLGASLGAILRYTTTQLGSKFFKGPFPLATFFVNILGSFILGFIYGLAINQNYYKIIGIGIMGGFTTFSTFNFELFSLIEAGDTKLFAKYFLLSYGLGFVFSMFGIILGTAVK